jgi:L-amino acid N-acyltransferase YncA
MSAALKIRPARRSDVVRVAAIYNQGIEDRVATFETRPRDESEVADWLGEPRPFLVAESDGTIIGFARVGPYSDRCVYDGVGEQAVYVDRTARGQGIGKALLEGLARAAEATGYYKLTSRVFTDNAASIAVHQAAGFERVGVQRRHGRLDGEWKDCVLLERLLGEAADDARPAS